MDRLADSDQLCHDLDLTIKYLEGQNKALKELLPKAYEEGHKNGQAVSRTATIVDWAESKTLKDLDKLS
tara:strand:+ start:2930 stop:3136 length:207 start_codon:yes stop_codon:yes gene_type:complete